MTWHNRHECKYVVPPAVAEQLLRRVEAHVAPDQHAAKIGGTYPISSLYLDDAVNTLYRETVEGRAHRFKLRIRSYEDRADLPVFLEVKRRHNGIVQKLRCPVPRQALPDLLRGDTTVVPELPPHQRQPLEEFVRLQQMQRAFPKLLVRYRRQAFVGCDEPTVRVTFDREMAASVEAESLVRHSGRFERLPLPGVIVEIKFTDQCPAWLTTSVRACELQRRSFSKYCRSAEALTDVGHAAMR